MSDSEYKNAVSDILNISEFNMNDSVFDEKYKLSETDVFYLIYQLIVMGKCSKNDTMTLLQSKEIDPLINKEAKNNE